MTLAPESAGTAAGRGRLTGRRIIVVGAGSRPSPDPEVTVGNGRAIAVLCAREGARVACVDVNEEAARFTADLCTQEGTAAVPIVADVRDAAACARLVEQAHEVLGGLDGTTRDVWDDICAVSVRSHLLVARAAMPLLEEDVAFGFIGSAAGLKAG